MAEVTLSMRTTFGPAADKAVAATKRISKSVTTVGVRVKAAAAKVKAGFAKMGASAKRAANVFKSSRLIQIVSLTAVIALVTKSIALFKVQEQAEAKLAAALVRTGKFRGDLFKKLKDQASAQQEVIGVGDEEILQAQALFISFGAQVDKIDELVEATANLAISQGMDFKAASLLMSKALAGNVSALSRYGLKVDEAKFKTDAAGAVIEGINSKFKGFARAVNETETGALARLGRRFGDLLEIFAKVILKSGVFKRAMEFLSRVIDESSSGMSSFEIALQFVFTVAAKVGDILKAVASKIFLVITVVQTLVAGFKAATAAIFGTKDEAQRTGAALDLMINLTKSAFKDVVKTELAAFDLTKFFEIGKRSARAQTTAEAVLNAKREEAARKFAEENKRNEIQRTIDLQNQAAGGGLGGGPGGGFIGTAFSIDRETGIAQETFFNPRTGQSFVQNVTINAAGVISGDPKTFAEFQKNVGLAQQEAILNNLGGAAGTGQTDILDQPGNFSSR